MRGEGIGGEEVSDMNLASRNLLALVEMLAESIQDALEATLMHPSHSKALMMDMIEFRNKMIEYTKKEISNNGK